MRKKRTEKDHRLKVISYWLLALGLLFLAGAGFRFYRTGKQSVGYGGGRVNFLLVGDQVSLVSFAPEQISLIVLVIPADVEIQTTRGFGSWRIGSVYQLGQIEGMGGELLKQSVQEYFGVPVDGWIKIKNEALPADKSLLLDLLKESVFARQKITNFSRWDLAQLWWRSRGILIHQTKVSQLDEIGALKSKVLLDGSKIWEIDRGRLDLWLQDNLYEIKIRSESLAIRVINATNHDGLAAHTARIISNMGGRVIEISNDKYQMTNDKCEARSSKERKEMFTVKKLLGVLGCGWVEEEGDGRAEVTVVIGQDYWRMLNEK